MNKLHKDFSDAEKVKLRNDIMDSTGIDIFNLPKNIVDDKPKLDSLLRAELVMYHCVCSRKSIVARGEYSKKRINALVPSP